jgi:hypothetical protein
LVDRTPSFLVTKHQQSRCDDKPKILKKNLNHKMVVMVSFNLFLFIELFKQQRTFSPFPRKIEKMIFGKKNITSVGFQLKSFLKLFKDNHTKK